MGDNLEAYDAERTALSRALESASRRQTTPERVTIFTDAQVAIRRIASEEPGPGQKYTLQARKPVTVLRKVRPGITTEIRWRLVHKGVAENEKDDEWAKLAGEEPDTRGMEWLSCSNQPGTRGMPLPRSLAHLKREISEKYSIPKSQRSDGTVSGSTERLASRFCRMKAAHCLTGRYLHWTKSRPTPSAGGGGARRRRGITSSTCAPSGESSRRSCGQRRGRRQGEGKASSRSGPSLPTGDANRRC